MGDHVYLQRVQAYRARDQEQSAIDPSGCAGLPEHVARTETHAIADPEFTKLGRIIAASVPVTARSLGESGFRLVRSGHAAFEHRIALIEYAQRSLDLQYYIIHDGESVRVIAGHLIAAAERGVRVRVLVDDFHTVGADAALIRFASHPGIEVRLFNPFGGARGSVLGRVIGGLGELRRLNRRMHNKLFIADNAMAITGGRNLGDEYFSMATDGELRTGRLDLESAPATLLADRPAKAEDGATRIDSMVLEQVADLLRSGQTEVILVSSYFIPGATGMALVREHRTRGVSVRVLTNSLASTDAPLAHVGYARYRLAMLEQGVKLNELGPLVDDPPPRDSVMSSGSSRASLHTKLINIDRRVLFIGSMNLDPRSAFENTEIGLVIEIVPF